MGQHQPVPGSRSDSHSGALADYADTDLPVPEWVDRLVDAIDICAFCAPITGETFDPREQHPECALRAALGGIGHLADHAYWCLEMGDPDMGLSARESANRVAEWVAAHGIDAAFHTH